jgi:hypothetical protein
MSFTAKFATLADLILVEPTIQDYGLLDWDVELARSQTEIARVLSVRWWPQFRKAKATPTTLLDKTLLDPTQWTQATVYHALAYHICPKLTKFIPETDKFQVMMEYYQGRFEHELDLCIREGVRYDLDDDDTIDDDEKVPDSYLRLQR